eukprot:1531126-Pyramimonas_sp.AAC.1
MLFYLVKEASDVPAKSKATLTRHWNTVVALPEKTALRRVQEHVRFLRLRACHYDKKQHTEPQMYKFQFMVAPAQQTLVMREADNT